MVLLITANESGGAGIACRRLFEALLQSGVDVHLLYFWCQDTSVSERVHSAAQLFKAKYGAFGFKVINALNLGYNRVNVGFDKKTFINGPKSLHRLEQLEIVQKAEIIHLHWVPKMIHFPTFFKQKDKKFVWTMHDMQPFTGGYHYATGTHFERYQTLFQKNEKLKSSLLQGVQLCVISPSKWLAQRATESVSFRDKRISVIPNPVELEIFCPQPREQARTSLGINHNPEITYLLFVAENVHDERKGFQIFLDALSFLDPSRIVLLVLGKMSETTKTPFETHHLGYITEPDKLALAYNAADMFVISSIEDNLPNTVVESLACGTPVVGFEIGGLPDMIIPNVTGQLALEIDAKLLSQAITKQQETTDLETQRQNCRSFAEQNFAYSVVAQRVSVVYQSF